MSADNQRLDPVETQARPAGSVVRAIAADKKFAASHTGEVHAYATFTWLKGGTEAEVSAACGATFDVVVDPTSRGRRALVTVRDVTCPACRGDVPVTSPAVTPKVEVLVDRDPDSGTYISVWVDGAKAEFTEEIIDPGYGHQRGEWDEYTAKVPTLGYSEAFAAAVIENRDQVAGSKYIEDDD